MAGPEVDTVFVYSICLHMNTVQYTGKGKRICSSSICVDQHRGTLTNHQSASYSVISSSVTEQAKDFANSEPIVCQRRLAHEAEAIHNGMPFPP